MKTTNFARYASLLTLAWCCTLGRVQAENAAAVNEVLKLKNAGVSEDTIVTFIQGKNINYDLSADNILALRNQGVTSAILNAMLASSQAPTAPLAPAPQPGAPQPPPVSMQPQQVTVLPPPSPGNQPIVVPQTVVAQPVANPDAAYFYQELSPYGRWIITEDGQRCWQPTVVLSTPGWRPYADKGHWVWTDQGWYWASDYSWGWAVFHYGRWNLHPHHGWIWYPDRVWGPAWVAWRSGGEYCGWAPLPPGAVYDTVGGHFIFHGKRVEAGFDFGLGFAHFSFCFTKALGEPVRQHVRSEAEVRAVYNHTTVINNYTVNRAVVGGETRVQVFNHGIEPAHIPAVKGRTFEPVHIEELRTPAPGHAHERLDPHRKTLEVYRPKFSDHR
jgi:hypothetical protein